MCGRTVTQWIVASRLEARRRACASCLTQNAWRLLRADKQIVGHLVSAPVSPCLHSACGLRVWTSGS